MQDLPRIAQLVQSGACVCRLRSADRDDSLFPLWLWDSLPLRRAFVDLDLGAALTIIRTASGLSQLEFATLLGWSQSAVARAEAATRQLLRPPSTF